jgi:UDP-N-acetylmuramyl pentapeptide phosphotransferase/UDP-N-acetylglucosamine-1-phosphate transferase
VVATVAPGLLRERAFALGLFEQPPETRRRRHRRPTIGGMVLAVAVIVGSCAADAGSVGARAAVAASVVALIGGWRIDRQAAGARLVTATRALAALAVPLAGARAGFTGTTVLDVGFTALATFAVICGFARLTLRDATPLVVGAVVGSGLLMAAFMADDAHAAVPAAAITAGCLGMLLHCWPPSVARIGRSGSIVIGGALAASVIDLDPEVGGSRALLVPVVLLAVPLAALVLHDLDRRLDRRRLHAHLALGVAALFTSIAGVGLSHDSFGLLATLPLAVLPIGALVLVAATVPIYRLSRDRSHRPARLALAGVACVVVAIGVVQVLQARTTMDRGRRAAEAGLASAERGDLERASAAFARASVAFASAEDHLRNPALRLGAVVPGLAQNLRASRALAEVGQDLAGTARTIAGKAGADDLRVVGGRFPIEAARRVSADLDDALRSLATSQRRLEDVASPFLVGEVSSANERITDRVDASRDVIAAAAEATRLAPELLGADRPKRWFVGIMSSSELRGAGGIIGDYAELRTDDGKISLVKNGPIRELFLATDGAKQKAALPTIYNDRYYNWKPEVNWVNLSVTPDTPTVGQAIHDAYPLTAIGAPLDGVILIDAVGLAALLQITGPVNAVGWGVPITADNAVQVLSFDQHAGLSRAQVDDFENSFVEELVGKLTTGDLASPSELAAVLSPVARGGHLQMWSPDDAAQAMFRRIGTAGELKAEPGSDFFEVVTEGGSEAKIDWFLRRKVRYEAKVDPGTGHVTATLTVTLTNGAPASGLSDAIIGRPTDRTTPGENRLFLQLHSALEVVHVTDVNGVSLTEERYKAEGGLTWVQVLLRVPPGGSTTVRYELAGGVDLSDGSYRLDVGHQPALFTDKVDIVVDGARGGPWQRSLRLKARTGLRVPVGR